MGKKNVCYHCFKELEEGVTGSCPHCGYDPAQDEGKYMLALPHGSVLNGRYITGRVLGQGGFGVTYLANDWKTNQRVAIKEYLPDTMAMRNGKYTISVNSSEFTDSFQYGKECFLEEARTLAAFIGNPNIVRVHSFFEENGTAYFVMDYVEGTSFQTYIKDHGGKVSWQEAEKFLFPVMDALQVVHSKGIVHRDVTPDNIFITEDGTVKLLDFGAARYSLGDRSRSLDVVLKHGFAPKEQYTRRGKQGPYTDVYTVAASFYYAVTGRKPPDSIERLDNDDLIPPSSLGIALPAEVEDGILKGMAVQPGDRYQSMAEFKNALSKSAAEKAENKQPAQSEAYIHCSACGTQMRKEDKFCPSCGAPAGSVTPEMQTTNQNLLNGAGSGSLSDDEKKKRNLKIILGCAIGGAALAVCAVTISLVSIFTRNTSGSGNTDNTVVSGQYAEANNNANNAEPYSKELDGKEVIKLSTPTPEPEPTPAVTTYTYSCNASLEHIELRIGDEQGDDIDSVAAQNTFQAGDYIYCNFSCSASGKIKSLSFALYQDSGILIEEETEDAISSYSSWYNGYGTYSMKLKAGQYYFKVTPTNMEGEALDPVGYSFTLKSTSNSNSSKNNTKKNEYILPQVATKYYPASTFKKMSAYKLRLARNEIYARHGYIFKDAALRKYFKSKSWYHPKKKDVKESEFNRYEKANLKMIQKYESKKN